MAFHAYEISTSNVEDREGAEKEIKSLVDQVNRTWERRVELTPDYEPHKRLTSMDVYQLLPQSNCSQCGEATCWNLALKLVTSQ